MTMRFRASGSLGMTSLHPEEVLNPSFPKAPLIPRDMHRMPNAVMAMPSLRPEEPGTDPADDPLYRHTDAQPPPPLVFVNADAPSMEPAAPRSTKTKLEKPAPEPIRAPEPAAGAAGAAIDGSSTQQAPSAKLVTTVLVLAGFGALALWLATRS
jgi:hypothetical protein